MDRIMFYRLLLALLLGFSFGMFVFGADPGDVQLQPLVDFDEMFGGMREWFTDILEQHYLLFISFFVVWLIYQSAMSFLQVENECKKNEDDCTKGDMRRNIERVKSCERW